MDRKKGQSLLRFVDDYTVIDIETTGHSLYYDRIIELSALKYRQNELVSKFSTLVNCEVKLNEFIIDLTGITDEMISDAPKIHEVIEHFVDFVSDDIVVGHNVNFDINFLYDPILKHLGICFSNDFIDTLRIARRLLHNLENHKLTTIAQYFGMEREIHRGLNDCETTHSVYQKIRQSTTPEDIDSLINPKKYYNGDQSNEYSSKLSTIQPTVSFDEILNHVDDFYFGKNVVITGRLTDFTKEELGQVIVNRGGLFSNSINCFTNVLILGNTDYQESIYKGKSSKHIKAEKLLIEGHDISIIDEKTAISLLK